MSFVRLISPFDKIKQYVVLRARLTSCRLLHLEKSNLLLNDSLLSIAKNAENIMLQKRELESRKKKSKADKSFTASNKKEP